MNSPLDNAHIQPLKMETFIHDLTLLGSSHMEAHYAIQFFDSDHKVNPEIEVVEIILSNNGVRDQITHHFDIPAKAQIERNIARSLGYTQ